MAQGEGQFPTNTEGLTRLRIVTAKACAIYDANNPQAPSYPPDLKQALDWLKAHGHAIRP